MASDQHEDGDVRQATDPTLARTVIEERHGYIPTLGKPRRSRWGGCHPAHVPRSEGEGDSGLLRVGFRDRDEDLKRISWEQFGEEFAAKDLVALYRDDGDDVEGQRPVVLRERDQVS